MIIVHETKPEAVQQFGYAWSWTLGETVEEVPTSGGLEATLRRNVPHYTLRRNSAQYTLSRS